MRHVKEGKKLDRSRGSRKALVRTMLSQFVMAEKIETTVAKAKYLQPKAERLVTEAKKQTLGARRHIIAEIGDVPAVEKLMSDIAIRFAKISGGYTKIERTIVRKGDGAQMAVLSYTAKKAVKEDTPKSQEKASKKETKPAKKPEKKSVEKKKA